MKLGRNDPCHCGSGKKYKKCCLDTRPVALTPERDHSGMLVGRTPIDTLWESQDKRARAVGNTLSIRPPNETNHEFYVDLLRHELGQDWNSEQLERPPEERHPLHQWENHWREARAGQVPEVERVEVDEGRFEAKPTGDLLALITLAYDVYSLKHSAALSDDVMGRLKNDDQFQGARYELAVGAVFLRAGYELTWLTETDRKLPEFIAKHRQTGTEIAVEAKSRHRPGILGREGETPSHTELKADVGRLLRNALQKETDGRPFVVAST